MREWPVGNPNHIFAHLHGDNLEIEELVSGTVAITALLGKQSITLVCHPSAASMVAQGLRPILEPNP